MPRNYKEARLARKLKVSEVMVKLGVSQPTLSAWENERKAPGIANLENMADLYGVTTDYLLGRTSIESPTATDPITAQSLPIFHGRPVWSAKQGWMLVNAKDRVLILSDGSTLSFENVDKIFAVPPPFTDVEPPHESPLTVDLILTSGKVWVEPISSDGFLRDELRGWYTVCSRWVENERGNRFFFENLGVKWLAFPLPE